MNPNIHKKLTYILFYSAVLALVFLAISRFFRTEPANFDSHQLRTKTDPTDAALSPDGKRVALVHRQNASSDTNQVDLLDVSTGQPLASGSIPRAGWAQNIAQYEIGKSLRFCDNGKYILAFDGLDTLYILDSSSLHPRTSISLNNLRILLGDPRRKLETVLHTNKAAIACASQGPRALIAFDVEGGMVSLMDFDSASDLEDIAGTFENPLNFGAFAISPSGSRIALERGRPGSSHSLEVLEVQPQKKLYRTVLTAHEDADLELSFAGESALVVAERGCPGYVCSPAPIPHGRTLTVWSFGEDGRFQDLGVEDAETYKWTGASSDGTVVYAYAGKEDFCKSCNGSLGELKIQDARFMLWDRKTGQSLGLSPKLNVENHSCIAFALAGCTPYQQPPELQMSDNGRAILAFWPRGPKEESERIVEVFTRR